MLGIRNGTYLGLNDPLEFSSLCPIISTQKSYFETFTRSDTRWDVKGEKTCVLDTSVDRFQKLKVAHIIISRQEGVVVTFYSNLSVK